MEMGAIQNTFPMWVPQSPSKDLESFSGSFFLSDLNVGHSHLSVNDSENKFWALLLYGSGSGSPKGTQRWEGLRKGRLGAKEKLGAFLYPWKKWPYSVFLRLLHFWL